MAKYDMSVDGSAVQIGSKFSPYGTRIELKDRSMFESALAAAFVVAEANLALELALNPIEENHPVTIPSPAVTSFAESLETV